jgi:hypothetical protein
VIGQTILESPVRNNTVPIAAGLIVLILIGGLFTRWFLNNYEYVQEQVRGNMGAEARRNPLLAAERYLSRLGITTESQSGRRLLVEPPPRAGLLLVRDLGAPLPQARVNALLAWVEEGGTLVVTPGSAAEEGRVHPLLEQFSVTLETDEISGEEVSAIALPWREYALQIEFDADTWFSVDSEDAYFASPDDGFFHLLRFPRGQGSVVFLSDNGFLTNDRIGDKDHALLLAYLAEDADHAWLLYDSRMSSLISSLWRYAPYLLISFTLFGIVLVRRLQYTTGPVLYPHITGHRDLLEHLQASAEFAWRHNPSVGLLERARKAVEKRWLASHPLLQQLDQKDRCDWLAKQTGMSPDSIHRALYSQQGDTGQLIKITTNLQRLFSALHPDRNEYNGSGSRIE